MNPKLLLHILENLVKYNQCEDGNIYLGQEYYTINEVTKQITHLKTQIENEDRTNTET